MKSQRINKIKHGQLVTRRWLMDEGFMRPDIDYYLRSGSLQAVVRGIYRRPGDPLSWESVVYALNGLGYKLHVGGATAIKERGFSHFVSMEDSETIDLYSHQRLPLWIETWHQTQEMSVQEFRFVRHKQPWLDGLPLSSLFTRSFGTLGNKISYASAELALLEILIEAKTTTDLVTIDRWLESMSSLSPSRLNELLLLCPNIKAKRLFGWFAERHNHAWASKISWLNIDLGKGKRSLIKGGRYNAKWKITVPQKLEEATQHGF